MKVILISGKAEHGKDTVAEIMEKQLTENGYRVLIAHYGDLVKYICTKFFSWNGEKDIVGRSLLQRVGTDVIRKQNENYWVGFIADILQFFPNEWDYVLIPDCRFPNEVDEIRRRNFDTTYIRVVRHNHISRLTAEQLRHPSETALDTYPADYYFNNDSTLDALANQIKTWIGETTND